ncbi:uncharacterized protein GGS22DRAFT_195450 [Annulohypoxylon maeteangense]|uniref:uncharacterized protein n=1 Tax=Annulohypoxylon maeteangense TaxID=1927788 RepID=UPI00200758FC|nr:uncharacterized protein GGS22DRAFT_195450 [Annulohypoxylon maeteangense]KAI0883259.1 hypothetical protein GGS22DRAFT_195450 [Annulohypoxylon maeteangense]
MSPWIQADVTDSVVVEIGSRTTNDDIMKQVEEEKPSDHYRTSWGIFSGDIMCYSPWDDQNLFARVRNSEIKSVTKGEPSMGRYKWYINYLLGVIYNPLGYSGRLRPPSYEQDKRDLSCPSLSYGSTASGSTFVVQTASIRLSRSGTPSIQDDELKQTESIRSAGPPKQNRVDPAALHGLGARFWTLPSSLEHLDLSDTDSVTETSSEDDDEDADPFDDLHQAIRQAFSSDAQLGEKVISYLLQLPPHRQAQVYGYRAISQSNNHGSDRPNIPNYDGKGSRVKKRKRGTNETSPSGLGDSKVNEGDEEDNQVVVSRRLSPELSRKRYACAYYKFDGTRYGPRAESRYKSCGGPGWKEFNHYKRHLQRVHLLHQCSRCGKICDNPDELHNHLAQDPRCPRSEGIEREGMSQQIWNDLQQAFKRNRRGHDNPSDEERWFRAWDVLFPGRDRPATPYYEKPPLPLVFTQIQGVFEASINTIPEMAQDSDLRDRIMGLLTSAIDTATQSAPLEFEAIGPNTDLLPVPVPMLRDTNTNYLSNLGTNPHGPISMIDWDPLPPVNGSGSLENDLFSEGIFNMNTAFDEDDTNVYVDAEDTCKNSLKKIKGITFRFPMNGLVMHHIQGYDLTTMGV